MIFKDLLSWTAEPFFTGADALIENSGNIKDAAKKAHEAVNSIDWTGESADAAREEAFNIRQALDNRGDDIAEVAAKLKLIAEDIKYVRSEAKTLNRDPEYLLDDYGTPRAGPRRMQQTLELMSLGMTDHRLEAELASFHSKVETVLDAARGVEVDLVALFGTSDSYPDLSSSAVCHLVPQGASGEEVAAWWGSLSEVEQIFLIINEPDKIGNLDGVAMWARSKANVLRVDAEIARLEQQIADHTWQDYSVPNLDPKLLGPTKLELINNLAELKGIQTAFNKSDWSQEHSLVYFSNEGQRVEAAVGVGDLDNAQHVGVYIPGMNSELSDLIQEDGTSGEYVTDMEDLNRKTLNGLEKVNRGKETIASVVWLGYQAPNTPLSFTADNIMSSEAAIAGGHKLAGFLDGLHDCRDTDPDLVTMAYSYGSTATGYALTEAQHVDRGTFFGSPGIGRDNEIADLNVPSDNLYFMEAKGDYVVDYLDGHGGALSRKGPSHTETNTSGGPILLGTSKTVQDDYAIHRLSTKEHTFPDGDTTKESFGHLEYTTEDTTAQHNLAAILGNTGDTVELEFGE